MKDSPWPERDEELRRHWATGASASVIGLAMHLSKNAVIGRAHRLQLPSRQSPIKTSSGPKRDRRAKRMFPASVLPSLSSMSPPSATPPIAQPISEGAGGSTPALASMPVRVPLPIVRPISGASATRQIASASRASSTLRLVPRPAPDFVAISRPCCWPEGEPGTPEFHFCEAPGVPGKPYCLPHCKRAYVRLGAEDDAEQSQAGDA